ncbi:uncharacterized protein LOC130648452 [Hydractinia symbiolongicarpus]|uniref:uncharacterized protein LOC130648452 n=1 Tax=Hydractinia symbiolongicarpus TaxID=13093 RepID=UPI00254FE0F8|nr:uncharacterized protein LOC130648452 [Hydractinia symbiolongicarpus]
MAGSNGFRVVLNSLGRFVLQRPANNTNHSNNNIDSNNAPNNIAEEFENDPLGNVSSSSRISTLPHVEVRSRRSTNTSRMLAHRAFETPAEAEVRRRRNAQQVAAARRVEQVGVREERLARNAEKRRHVRENARRVFHNIARDFGVVSQTSVHTLGPMSDTCPYCSSKKFQNEGNFKCCQSGKVALPELNEYPEELTHLLTGREQLCKNFQTNIRKYNSSFAFASLGANIRPPQGHGPPCFRISGQLFHRSGCLHPPENVTPSFNQLYIIDSTEALNIRLNNPANAECLEEVMHMLHTVMERESPFSAAFKNMFAVEMEENQRAVRENRPASQVTMRMLAGGDRRRYNTPTQDEVAVVFVGEDGAPPTTRDIVIYPKDRPLTNLSTMSANVDPMMYPVFFPRGDPGWYNNILHVEEHRTARRQTVTMLQFYVYRLAVRNSFSSIHYGKKLLQQYIVDAYTKVEGQRLDFIRRNQAQLRAESYQGLVDHLSIRADERQLNPGRIIILPSSFQGSPRAMRQNYMDAMAIVAKYGKPDLFLTFTCNPNWPEVKDNLFPGQSPCDRPDLIARVFNLKLRELLADIHTRGVLGKTIAYVHVIEFQKRGLPHVHMLIHLTHEDKLRHADDIDTIISAEIPLEIDDPQLYKTIKSCMIHGPCGHLNPVSVCMVDGKCSKEFPKDFSNSTVSNRNGYPKYRRRDNGRTITIRNSDIDNRWIVPYNPYLSKKYNAHINIEACMTVKAVKYLYKYIYKGFDCANIQINERLDHDEVTTFLDARYVSSPEACWRLFAYNLHDQSHVIFRLALHLPNYERVYFREGDEAAAVERAENRLSHLTAWFLLNQQNANANMYLYTDIPYHFVFDKSQNKWKVRRRGGGKIISRMYSSNPKEGERFYLRVLLLHVPGATSFEFLRTFNDHLYPTFREACLARGLLEGDDEWERTLEEVTAVGSPRQLRQTFCFLLTHCDLNNPLQLWLDNRMGMIEDFSRTMEEVNAELAALSNIATTIRQSGKSLADFGLPEVEELPADPDPDLGLIAQDVAQIRPTLNRDQVNAADTIIGAVTNVCNGNPQNSRLFYLDGPGGTGKTYTYNYIIKYLQSREIKVATCAWTGIAATLLNKGVTVHSLFRLPVPIVDTSTCNLSPTSHQALSLREKDLIVFDECSMIPKYALQAIDTMLRDITNVNLPFGGKVVLLGGDFRQILPVVKKARPAEVIDVCLKSSYIWPLITSFQLRLNMRAGLQEQEFADWLLQLGSDQLPTKPADPFRDCIEIPPTCVLKNSENLIDIMFDGIIIEDYSSRVILSATNEDTLQINDEVLEKIPGDVITYNSADSVVADDVEEQNLYPLEFLNSLTPSGMPPHSLKLKVGAVVMLLRNLDLKSGLCNGTRLVVRHLRINTIDAEILTGIAQGHRVLIPKVQLTPSDTGLPFQLRRRQFPLRLSYAMTINKAQGQTFEKVGIFLRRPCFSHGQLYVAFSRARSFNDIKVKVLRTDKQGYVLNKSYTKNVVYQQVL